MAKSTRSENCNEIYFQLKFDNKPQAVVNSDLVREEARLPAVSSAMLFDIFPFIIVFGEDMVIYNYLIFIS